MTVLICWRVVVHGYELCVRVVGCSGPSTSTGQTPRRRAASCWFMAWPTACSRHPTTSSPPRVFPTLGHVLVHKHTGPMLTHYFFPQSKGAAALCPRYVGVGTVETEATISNFSRFWQRCGLSLSRRLSKRVKCTGPSLDRTNS